MASFYLGRDNVRALHRIRVLVATNDRRFLRVSAFLLERSGLQVHATPRMDEVPLLVERHEPQVLIFDASESLASAARMLAALETLYPELSLIVVADDAPATPSATLRVLPKWRSVARLVDEVELAYVRARRRSSAHGGLHDRGSR